LKLQPLGVARGDALAVRRTTKLLPMLVLTILIVANVVLLLLWVEATGASGTPCTSSCWYAVGRSTVQTTASAMIRSPECLTNISHPPGSLAQYFLNWVAMAVSHARLFSDVRDHRRDRVGAALRNTRP
jgi:hypothetical protein